jgi:hypothetical protein
MLSPNDVLVGLSLQMSGAGHGGVVKEQGLGAAPFPRAVFLSNTGFGLLANSELNQMEGCLV